MSYNPVNTNSRSNSPVHFDQPGQHDQSGQYGQHGQRSSAATFPAYLEQLNKPYPTGRELVGQNPTGDPFQSTAYEISAASSSTISNGQYQQYPQQHQRQVAYGQQQQQPYQPYSGDLNANPSYLPGFQSALPPATDMRFQKGTATSARSYDARDNSSSHRSSAHNLATGNDPDYNLTQTDSTLEALAERWQAYQAWWAKQYREQPFYRIWTKSKWILLLSTSLLLAYSGAIFAFTLLYMLGRLEYAAVVMEFHGILIYIAFFGSIIGILTALVGLIGVFRENRIWLSWYSVMLWPVFMLYLTVGYLAFRRAKNQLRAHLKDEWMHSYSRDQRLLVQRNLKCCGFQDPTWYGEYDLRCFPMINLPGCQHKYTLYEDKLLSIFWTLSFSLVPFQLFVMVAALLCSNHVDGMLRSGRPGLKSFKEQ